MKNLEFLGVDIVVDGEVEMGLIDLGGITLQLEDRECMLDIVKSKFVFEDGQTRIECEVEEDKEVFPDCKYNLTPSDLIVCKLDIAEIFIGGEYTPESQTLFVKSGGLTKAIDLNLE